MLIGQEVRRREPSSACGPAAARHAQRTCAASPAQHLSRRCWRSCPLAKFEQMFYTRSSGERHDEEVRRKGNRRGLWLSHAIQATRASRARGGRYASHTVRPGWPCPHAVPRRTGDSVLPLPIIPLTQHATLSMISFGLTTTGELLPPRARRPPGARHASGTRWWMAPPRSAASTARRLCGTLTGRFCGPPATPAGVCAHARERRRYVIACAIHYTSIHGSRAAPAYCHHRNRHGMRRRQRDCQRVEGAA